MVLQFLYLQWTAIKKVKEFVDLAIGKNTQSMFDASHKVIGGNATDQALMKFIGEKYLQH